MGIKNQRTLLISAAAIVGVTAAGMVGLNVVVDKISAITPPQAAMMEPRRQVKPMGTDDALQPPPNMPFSQGMAPDDQAFPPKRGDMRARPDATRRVRNGKDAPDLRRARPTPRDMGDNGQNGAPPMPPQDAYPPPQNPPAMDPREREMMQEEMERRREMYYPPPQDFYPPPGFDDRDGYDFGPPDDYYEDPPDFDYYNQDWNSRIDDKDDRKTAHGELSEPYHEDNEESDEYLQEAIE